MNLQQDYIFKILKKLLEVLNRLLEKGNTVIIIEHNLDVIKTADHIIDIGVDGGENGGTVVAVGTPEEIAKSKKSYTGKYIAKIFKKEKIGLLQNFLQQPNFFISPFFQ